VTRILAGAVGVSCLALAVLGVADAAAVDEYKGRTYEQAQSSISSWGGKIEISSRVGSYLPTEQCVVSGSRTDRGRSAILLDLNCNDTAAVYGHPGNSVTSPQGKRVQQRRESAERLSNNYEKAIAAGQEPYCARDVENCIAVCEEARSCSAELSEFLGL
jgi:hypothetical protein